MHRAVLVALGHIEGIVRLNRATLEVYFHGPPELRARWPEA